MNHQEYKNKYLGKFQKEPGMKTSECVWNSKLYAKEVHGITLGGFGGSALSGWENKSNTFEPKKWRRVLNTPDAIATQGDIVFWGTALGKYGHVAVFDSGNLNVQAVLSQNSTGANGDVPGDEIILKMYTYRGCLGWFTPIK